jgi:uncharacterized membrane protein YphA (DoxX/SURF4 family)
MTSAQPSKGLHVGLWIAQGLLAVNFVGAGVWKLATPVAALAAKMPWMGQVSPGFLYATAAFDLLGGIGVVLPSLTRIRPGVTVWAALGCAALQASAVVFHLSRGEAANTPFNFVLIGLSLLVAWGRRAKAPIEARG